VNIGDDARSGLELTRKMNFTPTVAGVYPIYCDKKLLFFASHRERGMEGALEIVP